MLIDSACHSLATWFHLPCKSNPARSRSHAIAKRNWPRGACANHCSLPIAGKAAAGASPIVRILLWSIEKIPYCHSSPYLRKRNISRFVRLKKNSHLRPVGHQSFHHDQVLKLIGSCQLRTNNASHVGRLAPSESCPLLEVPGIRPRCLVLECARAAEPASKR